MSLNIHISSTPPHLKITPTMVDDFLVDPVLGVYVIFGIKLDVFQACGLRLAWFVPDYMDSSGFGTGKSLRFWLFMNLRCVVIGDQHAVAYYQTFQAAKDIFWPYYKVFNSRRAPLFAAQLGQMSEEGDVDGKDNNRGAACYKQFFKNDSIVYAPAPNWIQEAKGQAGLTFNVAGIDEWTKVETMTKKSGQVTNEQGQTVGGINQQILGRVRRASWNQHHPIWGNHRYFSATAESLRHPGYPRHKVFLDEISRGNPNYAVFTSCFKDFSNLRTERDIRIENGRLTATLGKPFKEEVPNWQTISTMKKQFTKAHYRREVLGLWSRETKGWYSEDNLDVCVARGVEYGTQPECFRNQTLPTVHYFMGIDPAPAQGDRNDDGAIGVLRARPRPGLGSAPSSNLSDWLAEFVYAYRVRGDRKRSLPEGALDGRSARHWSGLIHRKHRDFGLSGILMDSQGGGQWILPELAKHKQLIEGIETECVPIVLPDDYSAGEAYHILDLYRMTDDGVRALWPVLAGLDNLAEAMHVVFQTAVENALACFPLPYNERPAPTTQTWSQEQKWALKNLDAAREQMIDIQVAVRDDGTWDLTRNGAKKFFAADKKDLAYACIMAWVRFLIWLKLGEFEENEAGGGDDMCYVVSRRG